MLGDGRHRQQLSVADDYQAAATDAADSDADYNLGADAAADVDKPIFRRSPSNITVSPGDRASLKCRVDNLGTKTVTSQSLFARVNQGRFEEKIFGGLAPHHLGGNNG